MEHLFKYRVTGMDCNGTGETETWVEYEGFDRIAAIKAKHTCEEKSIAGFIHILTPSSKGWHDRRLEEFERQEKEILDAAEEAYWNNMAIHQDEFEAPEHEIECPDEMPFEECMDEIWF